MNATAVWLIHCAACGTIYHVFCPEIFCMRRGVASYSSCSIWTGLCMSRSTGLKPWGKRWWHRVPLEVSSGRERGSRSTAAPPQRSSPSASGWLCSRSTRNIQGGGTFLWPSPLCLCRGQERVDCLTVGAGDKRVDCLTLPNLVYQTLPPNALNYCYYALCAISQGRRLYFAIQIDLWIQNHHSSNHTSLRPWSYATADVPHHIKSIRGRYIPLLIPFMYFLLSSPKTKRWERTDLAR